MNLNLKCCRCRDLCDKADLHSTLTLFASISLQFWDRFFIHRTNDVEKNYLDASLSFGVLKFRDANLCFKPGITRNPNKLKRVISFPVEKCITAKELHFSSVAMLMNEREGEKVSRKFKFQQNNGATCFIKNEFRHVS